MILAAPSGVSLLFSVKHLAEKWDSFRSMIFQGFSKQCPTGFGSVATGALDACCRHPSANAGEQRRARGDRRLDGAAEPTLF